MTPLPHEFLLVAACCRWPFRAAEIAGVVAAAGRATDWPYVLRIARRQRVVGLFHRAVQAAGVTVPADTATALAADADRIARQSLALAAESARLQSALDNAGIDALVLKGAPLAQLAYGSLAVKHSRDIDLLVRPEQAEAALQVLTRDGYTLKVPADALDEAQRRTFVRFGNEFALSRQGREPLVELRWRATDNMRLLAGMDAFGRSQAVAMSDRRSIHTPGDADLFAYLCAHGASHAWSRLKWLADVNALLARAGGTEIERLYRHAEQLGAGACAGQALLLCEALLGLILPVALAAELHRSRRLKLLVAFALDAMVGPDAVVEVEERPFGSTRVALMQFLLGRSPAFLLAQARVASVRITDVLQFPLPPRLHFLYPLLRLPMWLWRRIWHGGGDALLHVPKRPRP